MYNFQGQRREIIELDEFPRSGTPEPALKRQRTSRKISSTNIKIPTERPRVTRSAGTVESAGPPQANGSVGRSSDPQRHRSEGRVELAEPTRANGSFKTGRLRQKWILRRRPLRIHLAESMTPLRGCASRRIAH